MAGKRGFGSIRQLASGNWQARYETVDGRSHTAPATFDTKRGAATWLARQAVSLEDGGWVDPSLGRIRFGDYAEKWIADRVVRGAPLRPRTRDLYERQLRTHLLPLAATPLGRLSPSLIRSWHSDLSRTTGPTATAQSYRLAHAILNTAVDDEVIARNPCRLAGAGLVRHVERMPATLAEVQLLADSIFPRYRALILLAVWTGARWGELTALTVDRLDLMHGRLTIDRQHIERSGGRIEIGPPKSDAGYRVVAIPPHILVELETHLSQFKHPRTDLVFCTSSGGPLHRAPFRTTFNRAKTAAGLDGLTFHDLRHTGNTLAASTGASLRELMYRMGHSSVAAAVHYQHATRERDDQVARLLSDLAAGQTAAVDQESHSVTPLRQTGAAG